MDVDKEWNSKRVFLIAFFSAVLISLDFTRYVLTLSEEECKGIMLWIKGSNLKLYLAVLAVFFIIFFGVRVVFLLLEFTAGGNGRFRASPNIQHIFVALPVILVLGGLVQWLCVNLAKEFPYGAHAMLPVYLVPKSLTVLFLILGAACVVYIAAGKKDLPSVCLWMIYALCLVFYFDAMNSINVYKADFYHKIAVFESIYNVCDFVPYTRTTSGIYGHYGLFFLLPMRMAHGSLYMLGALMGLCGCITEAAVLYVCHTFLQNNILRAVAACSSVFFAGVCVTAIYWQVWPLRVLFPMVMCAYVCFLVKHKQNTWCSKWMWLGYLLAGTAIIWNTESGVFCVIAVSVYILMEQLQIYQWYEKCMVKMYIKLIFSSIGSVVFAVTVVNIYNFLCGGKLILIDFFVPLFSESYMNDALRYDPVWGNYAWVYTFVLFLAVLAWAVFHTRLFQDKAEKICRVPAAAAIAVLGLLLFSYYLNRAAYGNLSICFPTAICANALIIRETWPALRCHDCAASLEVLAKRAVAIVTIVILVFLGIQMPYGAVRMSERRKIGSKDITGIEKGISDIANSVPENTYGAGGGISILYHMLGWDNYAHVRDISDFYLYEDDDAAEYVIEKLLEQDRFLLNDWRINLTARLFLLEPYYQIVDSFEIEGSTYCYYERCEEKVTDWLPRLVTVSEENRKSTDSQICISPEQFITGSNIFRKKGRYVLSVTVDGEAEVEISFEGKPRLHQKLSKGENHISFWPVIDLDQSEFKITNTSKNEIMITHLDLQAM